MVPTRLVTRAIAALALAACVAAGCDDGGASATRRQDPATAAPGGTEAPQSQATWEHADTTDPAATSPAATRPASSYLAVDGRPAQFPPARLRLTRNDDGVRALLYSDDPKNAVSPDYRGNSFYFDVPLRIADVRDVAGAEYFYKAKSSEAEDDSPNGIFLNGMRTHLQPQDVVIRFDGEAPRVVAKLTGRFLVVHTNEHPTPGQFAAVTGTLFTTVEVKDE